MAIRLLPILIVCNKVATKTRFLPVVVASRQPVPLVIFSPFGALFPLMLISPAMFLPSHQKRVKRTIHKFCDHAPVSLVIQAKRLTWHDRFPFALGRFVFQGEGLNILDVTEPLYDLLGIPSLASPS